MTKLIKSIKFLKDELNHYRKEFF